MRKRRHDKPDANTAEIVAALRQAGVVFHYGPPLDGWAGWNGRWTLLEFKAEKGVLADHQRELIDDHRYRRLPVAVVRSVEEAFRAVGLG